ncbi:MAG: hypothetical protein PWQ73_637 [Petrotoga sp.]|nr:hypothetical protein [Petrotoga sp.]
MNNKPKYEKIKEFLIANIENGTYQPDEQIPSEKALAKEFKVSRETVRKALDKLVFEGYLYRIQGLGTFVSPIKGSSSSPMQEKNKIGVVLPISHEYLSFEILAGIEKAYHNTEYEPFVQFIDSNSAITKLKMKYILSSNPKGYIILPTKELVEDEIFKRLLKKEVPMVFVDKTVNNIRKPLVQSDNYLGAYNLTKELIQNSTVKSTMFFSEEDFSISSVKERYNGMSDACKEHNIPVYSEIVGKNEMDRSIDKCLKYHVDTIFCCNDIVAVSTLTALQVRGLSVPEKVKLYGFDDRPIAQSIFPNLTTVRQPLRNMGEVAAKYLVSIIQGENNSEDFKITLPVELVWRDSTGQKIK